MRTWDDIASTPAKRWLMRVGGSNPLESEEGRARVAREIAERIVAAMPAGSKGDGGEKLTLDANLLHDYWKQRPRRWAIERLLELATAGEVDVAVNRYVRDDVPDPPLRDRLDELPRLHIRENGGVFQLGISALGGSDGFGSDEFVAFERYLAKSWKPTRGRPPDRRDWLHLHAHHIQGRDRFLTWDEPPLELGALLEPIFRLGVARPDDYLAAHGEASG
jgi:hypothetical protein